MSNSKIVNINELKERDFRKKFEYFTEDAVEISELIYKEKNKAIILEQGDECIWVKPEQYDDLIELGKLLEGRKCK